MVTGNFKHTQMGRWYDLLYLKPRFNHCQLTANPTPLPLKENF